MLLVWRSMKLSRICSAAIALIAVAGGAWTQPKTHASATFITGGATGTWYMAGVAIAELVNEHYDGHPVSVVLGKGAIANPLSVGAGKAEFGLSYAPVPEARLCRRQRDLCKYVDAG